MHIILLCNVIRKLNDYNDYNLMIKREPVWIVCNIKVILVFNVRDIAVMVIENMLRLKYTVYDPRTPLSIADLLT